ncbi:MAG: lysophospholipid acyltransferase family protein [Smithellaceae bacterium]
MPLIRNAQRLMDLFITLLLWFYFIFGSIFFFFLFYLPAYFFAASRVTAFQNLNHIHMKKFFTLTQWLIPRTKFAIQKEVREIHSSVIVCNHLSYLDPILLISLLPRQRTIVKSTFFKIPFFGWLLKNSGYVPAAGSEMLGPAMIKNLENIKEHLAAGGNLFVFPEGTRSRDGKLKPFNKGVFSIARYCDAPLALIFVKDTNKLFRPGSFLFNTGDVNEIKVELIGSLMPDYQSNDFSISAVADQARLLFEEAMARN